LAPTRSTLAIRRQMWRKNRNIPAATRLAPIRRLHSFDALVAILGAVALCLVGPLRTITAVHPPVAFLGTFFLFMVPGVVLGRWFLGERFPGPALVPVAFVLSAGLFGVLAVPFLLLHAGLGGYLWVTGIAVFGSLVAAASSTFVGVPSKVLRAKDDLSTTASVGALWVPLVALGAALAYASGSGAPRYYGDMWVYLAWVRDYLSAEHLALHDPYIGNKVTALSRVRINGWLVEQAAMSRVSGVDPVEMVMRYLAPILVLAALLAFYALVLALLQDKLAALFTSCLYALFFLVNLAPTQFAFGGEFVGRIAEDKFVARFFFLPVALCLAVAFLETWRYRYLVAFAFVSWSAVVVHPIGLALIGLCMAGFGLAHVAAYPRSKQAWTGMTKLGVALVSFGIVPALFMAVTGKSFVSLLESADINSENPAVLENMVFVVAKRERILSLGDGTFIMHPYLLHDPVILGALLLGLPFLLLRLKRALAARMLAGVLVLVTVVCYEPSVATFVGNNIVVPGQLWRLAWPLPLAAVLSLGWMGWEVVRRGRGVLERSGVSRRITAFLPLAVVIAMMVVSAPASEAALAKVHQAGGPPYGGPTCFAPVFPWLRNNITEPTVVLAPDTQNTCIPAYSANANVVSVRGSQVLSHLKALERLSGRKIEVPQRALDERRFFRGSTTPAERQQILGRYNVDYVLVHAGSQTARQLNRLPGLSSVEVPGKYFDLYKVIQRRP
jgi:Family of unknown function (DUF6077)